MLMKIRKHLVFAVMLLSLGKAQNDSLVVEKHSNQSKKSEGYYINGVRDSIWTEWFEGVAGGGAALHSADYAAAAQWAEARVAPAEEVAEMVAGSL